MTQFIQNDTDIPKDFNDKYFNTRCPEVNRLNYYFFDGVHPISHSHRSFAQEFANLLNNIGINIGNQDIIDVVHCDDSYY